MPKTYNPRYQGLTARLYQCGMERDEALRHGADATLFDSLTTEFRGGSIPVHLLYGFAPSPSYGSEHHTGGERGRQLRETIAAHNRDVACRRTSQ